jgi:nicotinamide-nucleotide amidase
VPGASRVFRGGFVVYSTDLKVTLVDVPAALLAARGPVDRDVAAAMAAGARRRCGADWGLATTGVAGPDPQDSHQVGTVWVAVAGPDGVGTMRILAPGDRPAVRAAAVRAALALLSDAIDPPDPAPSAEPAPGRAAS